MENDLWILELEGKPDFEMAMKRIYAWYNQSIIDRVPIRFSAHNADFILHEFKIDELTDIALAKAPGKFMVGYTDIHPSVDCAAAWRDPQQFCTDLLIYPLFSHYLTSSIE